MAYYYGEIIQSCKNMSPPRPKIPLVDIFPWYTYVIYMNGTLGLGEEERGTYFYNNFCETHYILHFAR